jgi:hypothetical protein
MNEKYLNIKLHGVVLVLYLLLLLFFFQRNILFWRDYSIIYEGAYRIAQGQIPFNDFGLPVGPMSLVIPAVFFKIFEPTWYILQISQLFQNGLILLFFLNILLKITKDINTIIFNLMSLTLFYLILLTNPWYNTTALICLLVSVSLFLSKNSVSIAISGLFCALSILSKQDYGGLNIFVIFVINTFIEKADNQFVLSIPKSIGCLIKRIIGRDFILFILMTVFTLIGIISLFHFDKFSYWFNYGQFPHNARTPSIELLINKRLILSLVSFYLSIKYKNIYFLVASLFIFTAAIVSFTSGLKFTSYFDVVFYPGIIIQLLKQSRPVLNVVNGAVVFLVLYNLILPSKFALLSLEAAIRHKVESGYFYDYREVGPDVESFPESLRYFKNSFGPRETVRAIEKLKEYVAGNFSNSREVKILNLSELTPIYAELDTIPPLDTPLWYDTTVSFFEKEQADIVTRIKKSEFDVLLIQSPHNVGKSTYYRELLKGIRNNSCYIEANFSDFSAPATALASCGSGDCKDTHVFLFLKKPDTQCTSF